MPLSIFCFFIFNCLLAWFRISLVHNFSVQPIKQRAVCINCVNVCLAIFDNCDDHCIRKHCLALEAATHVDVPFTSCLYNIFSKQQKSNDFQKKNVILARKPILMSFSRFFYSLLSFGPSFCDKSIYFVLFYENEQNQMEPGYPFTSQMTLLHSALRTKNEKTVFILSHFPYNISLFSSNKQQQQNSTNNDDNKIFKVYIHVVPYNMPTSNCNKKHFFTQYWNFIIFETELSTLL